MPNIIEARDVVKTYRTGEIEVRALQGVDLAIGKGQMVAVMGPSGCGKTTLLNTFSGMDGVTSGDVLIDGTSVHQMSDKERTRFRARNMGFVFQAYNLLPVLTGAENVELPLLLSVHGQAKARALEALEMVGLAD